MENDWKYQDTVFTKNKMTSMEHLRADDADTIKCFDETSFWITIETKGLAGNGKGENK